MRWRWENETLVDEDGNAVLFGEPLKDKIAAIPRMLELLQELEWAGNQSVATCPLCERRPKEGHGNEYDGKPCRLGALLTELGADK